MILALYKGTGGTLWQRLWDRLVRMVTASPYSHCELVINGVCWSSSMRDGGVRGKSITLDPAKWDQIDLGPEGDKKALHWFLSHEHEGYDYKGVLRFLFEGIHASPRRWFCSEACAAALGLDWPEVYTPGDLESTFRRKTTT